MKKTFFIIMMTALLTAAVSCEKKGPSVYSVSVQLTVDGENFAKEGVNVSLSSDNTVFESATDASGLASFKLAGGVYTASASFKQPGNGAQVTNYNGTANIAVDANLTKAVALPLTASKSSRLIIKELYSGGCMDNAGTKAYLFDKYIVVYNNSDTEVDAGKMCVAMAQLTSTAASNKYTVTNGVTEYAAAGWTPASYSIWWFQDGTQVKIAPYSQIVIAICGAIDHTKTYSNSVDLSNADYCMYDHESGFKNPAYYPAPSSNVAVSHYMKTHVFGMGNAWPLHLSNAAPYIIMPETDIKAFVKDPKNFDKRTDNLSGNFAKIPTTWILDAIDIRPDADETKHFSRFPAEVNTGYKVLKSKLGHTMYRNVDKAATEAIAENAGKLVYNYSGAVSAADNDLSGIDAEASMKAGAKIVFMDTNNSAKDFHERAKASIKK